MSNPVHKKVEVVGTSEKSFSDAVSNAIEKASQSLHGLEWFEVGELRGRVGKNKVKQFQATLKIGFKLD